MPDEDAVDGSADPSDELRFAFWSLVVLVDVALLATALGLLLVFLEQRLVLGGASLAVGIVGFAVCYRRVRARRKT